MCKRLDELTSTNALGAGASSDELCVTSTRSRSGGGELEKLCGQVVFSPNAVASWLTSWTQEPNGSPQPQVTESNSSLSFSLDHVEISGGYHEIEDDDDSNTMLSVPSWPRNEDLPIIGRHAHTAKRLDAQTAVCRTVRKHSTSSRFPSTVESDTVTPLEMAVDRTISKGAQRRVEMGLNSYSSIVDSRPYYMGSRTNSGYISESSIPVSHSTSVHSESFNSDSNVPEAVLASFSSDRISAYVKPDPPRRNVPCPVHPNLSLDVDLAGLDCDAWSSNMIGSRRSLLSQRLSVRYSSKHEVVPVACVLPVICKFLECFKKVTDCFETEQDCATRGRNQRPEFDATIRLYKALSLMNEAGSKPRIAMPAKVEPSCHDDSNDVLDGHTTVPRAPGAATSPNPSSLSLDVELRDFGPSPALDDLIASRKTSVLSQCLAPSYCSNDEQSTVARTHSLTGRFREWFKKATSASEVNKGNGRPEFDTTIRLFKQMSLVNQDGSMSNISVSCSIRSLSADNMSYRNYSNYALDGYHSEGTSSDAVYASFSSFKIGSENSDPHRHLSNPSYPNLKLDVELRAMDPSLHSMLTAPRKPLIAQCLSSNCPSEDESPPVSRTGSLTGKFREWFKGAGADAREGHAAGDERSEADATIRLFRAMSLANEANSNPEAPAYSQDIDIECGFRGEFEAGVVSEDMRIPDAPDVASFELDADLSTIGPASWNKPVIPRRRSSFLSQRWSSCSSNDELAPLSRTNSLTGRFREFFRKSSGEEDEAVDERHELDAAIRYYRTQSFQEGSRSSIPATHSTSVYSESTNAVPSRHNSHTISYRHPSQVEGAGARHASYSSDHIPRRRSLLSQGRWASSSTNDELFPVVRTDSLPGRFREWFRRATSSVEEDRANGIGHRPLEACRYPDREVSRDRRLDEVSFLSPWVARAPTSLAQPIIGAEDRMKLAIPLDEICPTRLMTTDRDSIATYRIDECKLSDLREHAPSLS